jgi:hypothetical protein
MLDLVSDLDGDLAQAPVEPVLFEIFRFVARIPNNIGMLIGNRYYRRPHPNLGRPREYRPLNSFVKFRNRIQTGVLATARYVGADGLARTTQRNPM